MFGERLASVHQAMRCGQCPDSGCGNTIYYGKEECEVMCIECGQQHKCTSLLHSYEITNQNFVTYYMAKSTLQKHCHPDRRVDTVKVGGFSHYRCKLLSPQLTYYGMDARTQTARLLVDMGKSELFDCAMLADRTFTIEERHVDTLGYGRDRTGSQFYLADVLALLAKFNGGREALVPIHCDGDGHCLVHAVSRALVGHQLFWHALCTNLRRHFEQMLDTYTSLFAEFVEKTEWGRVIEESDPDYLPPSTSLLGMTNLHLFGLANILHRPIILLDALSEMSKKGDYSGIFLPALLEPDKCRTKEGKLHRPLCIAWSSASHHHYIALVPIRGKPLANLPPHLVPTVWGVPQDLLQRYVDVNADGSLTVGGEKSLQEEYISRLVGAIELVFTDKHGVSSTLVSDVYHYLHPQAGAEPQRMAEVIGHARRVVQERRLVRCLFCNSLTEWQDKEGDFKPGGAAYEAFTRNTTEPLEDGRMYTVAAMFKSKLRAMYIADSNEFVPDSIAYSIQCKWCTSNTTRHVTATNKLVYGWGDKTATPSLHSNCACGFKHHFYNREYDNLPKMVPVSLDWNGVSIKETVYWFEGEDDASLNSNVFDVAQNVVNKHFPGEFGSERLVQRVVDTLLRLTRTAELVDSTQLTEVDGEASLTSAPSWWQSDQAHKILLHGNAAPVHKEDLTHSQTEKIVRARLETTAPFTQKRQQTSSIVMHSVTSPTSQVAGELTGGESDMEVIHTPCFPLTTTLGVISPAVDVTSLTTTGVTSSTSVEFPTTSVTSPPTTEASPAAPGGAVRVRVTTSSGKQLILSLPSDTLLYQQLQVLLCSELGVSSSTALVIRSGFPPRLLGASDSSLVHLCNGDKLTVDLPTTTATTSKHTSASGLHIAQVVHPSKVKSAEDEKLAEQLSLLTTMSQVLGIDLWTYVKSMPALFTDDGIFVQLVSQSVTLTDKKHVIIPALPGKTFSYNAAKGRLELCLEPEGHFAVSPDVEEQAAAGQDGDEEALALLSTMRSILAQGATGVSTFKNTTHLPFQGSGHKLKQSEDHGSTEDTNAVHIRNTAGTYKRIGPGQSVLDTAHMADDDINDIE